MSNFLHEQSITANQNTNLPLSPLFTPLIRNPKNQLPTLPHLHHLPPLQHPQRPRKRLLTIPPPIHKLVLQLPQRRRPPYWQSPPELLFDFLSLGLEVGVCIWVIGREGGTA